MHLPALPPWFGLSFLAAMCLLATVFGRWEERAGAWGMALATAATLLLRDWHWTGTQWGGFGVDLAYLGLLIFIALRSRRYWPLFAAGFHLLAIATHAGRMIDPKLNSWTYATAEVIWTYFVMYAILFGIWGRWKERRRASAPVSSAP